MARACSQSARGRFPQKPIRAQRSDLTQGSAAWATKSLFSAVSLKYSISPNHPYFLEDNTAYPLPKAERERLTKFHKGKNRTEKLQATHWLSVENSIFREFLKCVFQSGLSRSWKRRSVLSCKQPVTPLSWPLAFLTLSTKTAAIISW